MPAARRWAWQMTEAQRRALEALRDGLPLRADQRTLESLTRLGLIVDRDGWDVTDAGREALRVVEAREAARDAY